MAENVFVRNSLEKKSILPFHTISWIGARDWSEKWEWSDGLGLDYNNGLLSRPTSGQLYWNSETHQYNRWEKDKSYCGLMREDMGVWESNDCGDA